MLNIYVTVIQSCKEGHDVETEEEGRIVAVSSFHDGQLNRLRCSRLASRDRGTALSAGSRLGHRCSGDQGEKAQRPHWPHPGRDQHIWCAAQPRQTPIEDHRLRAEWALSRRQNRKRTDLPRTVRFSHFKTNEKTKIIFYIDEYWFFCLDYMYQMFRLA